MGSLPRACHLARTNGPTARVHEASLAHIWLPRFSYAVGVTKQMGHVAILARIGKCPFSNAKWQQQLESALAVLVDRSEPFDSPAPNKIIKGVFGSMVEER
jgi:hypothetical protein